MFADPFPSKHQLLQACRAEPALDHPILHCAHELTALHEQLLCAPASPPTESDARRATLIAEIDRWTTSQLPPSHGSASIHTETLGAVIDRLAHRTTTAYAALTTQGDWNLWDAWERLAELAIGYADLTTDLTTGRRRLPGGP
ncbi:DUF4254 domain-containing protein [Nocardia sp. NPDC051570]|uniref:DUF4254 domain-containing protein n=1 Tax=Nocardia sp. NPDC051570 TaxID=3364324 RepID=UPI0037BD84D4